MKSGDGEVVRLRDLIAALWQGRRPSKDSFEMLSEHEQALRRLYPGSSPSGSGSDRYDEIVALRSRELRWRLFLGRLILIASLAILLIGVALSASAAWERFFG